MIIDDAILEADIVVVGGGSAGSTAAIFARQSFSRGRVILLEKENIKRSGAIGMDGLNNAIIPGPAPQRSADEPARFTGRRARACQRG